MARIPNKAPKQISKPDFYHWFFGDNIVEIDIKEKTFTEFAIGYKNLTGKLLDIPKKYKEEKLDIFIFPKHIFNDVYQLFDIKETSEINDENNIWHNSLPQIFCKKQYRSYSNGVIYYDDFEEFGDEKEIKGDSLFGGGDEDLFVAAPLSYLRTPDSEEAGRIYFLSLPNQNSELAQKKLFSVMKEYDIKDIINFQSCSGITMSEDNVDGRQNKDQLRSWVNEFYSLKRGANEDLSWRNCQYFYLRKQNIGGEEFFTDAYNSRVSPEDVRLIESLKRDGDWDVSLQDRTWMNGDIGISDHVTESRRRSSNSIINYKSADPLGIPAFGQRGNKLKEELWNIHWSDGSPGNEEMWSLLSSCLVRTLCYEKRNIAIHCWGGFGRTGSALLLAAMIQTIFLHPERRDKLKTLPAKWFQKLARDSKEEVAKLAKTIFKHFNIFQNGELDESFDDSSVVSDDIKSIARDINRGKNPGRSPHDQAKQVRFSEIISSKQLIQRVSQIMRQVRFLCDMFGTEEEIKVSSLTWNPYILELYYFLKNGGIGPGAPGPTAPDEIDENEDEEDEEMDSAELAELEAELVDLSSDSSASFAASAPSPQASSPSPSVSSSSPSASSGPQSQPPPSPPEYLSAQGSPQYYSTEN